MTDIAPALAAKTETVTDDLGRKLVVKKLTALEKMDLFALVGSADCDNKGVMSYAMAAASVISINDVPYAFPENAIAMRARIALLSDEGLEAALPALGRLSGNIKQTAELAKN